MPAQRPLSERSLGGTIWKVFIRLNASYATVLLCLVLGLLGLNFYDWPPNRDITTYATIAQELINGKELYVDVWDFKPPAIFATYMIAQWLISSKPLQILLLISSPASSSWLP